MASIKVRDAGDLKAVVKQLRQVADGKQLRKELTGGIRDVLNPIRDEVKAAYLTSPGYRGRIAPTRSRAARPPLRTLLARSTRTEVRTAGKLAGARIRVDGRKMPPGTKSLPAYYEGEKRPWRAPLFGDRDRWYTHRAKPTFYGVVEPHEGDAGRAIDQVLDDVRRKLESGR